MRGAPLTLVRLSSISAAATFFLAACGGTPAAQPTTAPVAPATSPAASPAAAVPAPSAAVASTLTGTIKIVSSLPRTGSNKGQTDTIVNSFKMALGEIGATDGVGAK